MYVDSWVSDEISGIKILDVYLNNQNNDKNWNVDLEVWCTQVGKIMTKNRTILIDFLYGSNRYTRTMILRNILHLIGVD